MSSISNLGGRESLEIAVKVKTLTAHLYIHYFINNLQNIHFTYCQN